jgi:hypothetical protein
MSIDLPARVVVLVAVLLVTAAAAFALLVLGRGKAASPSATPTPTHVVRPTHPAAPKPDLVVPVRPATPKLKLTPGLPAPIAYMLARHPAVVVAVFGHAKGDRDAVTEARAGAAMAHTSFLALDVTKQKYAEPMASFSGTLGEPAVFVVKRPGTIVRTLQGVQDRQVVAQAAHHVG